MCKNEQWGGKSGSNKGTVFALLARLQNMDGIFREFSDSINRDNIMAGFGFRFFLFLYFILIKFLSLCASVSIYV